MRRAFSIAVLTALAVVTFAAPASATVHEITGMFCAGQNANYGPAGITGGSNANNFAKPLFATGFIESVAAYAGDSGNPPGRLITFDFDHPASKLVAHPTIATFYFGGGTYVSAFILDPDHGFTNCVALRA